MTGCPWRGVRALGVYMAVLAAVFPSHATGAADAGSDKNVPAHAAYARRIQGHGWQAEMEQEENRTQVTLKRPPENISHPIRDSDLTAGAGVSATITVKLSPGKRTDRQIAEAIAMQKGWSKEGQTIGDLSGGGWRGMMAYWPLAYGYQTDGNAPRTEPTPEWQAEGTPMQGWLDQATLRTYGHAYVYTQELEMFVSFEVAASGNVYRDRDSGKRPMPIVWDSRPQVRAWHEKVRGELLAKLETLLEPEKAVSVASAPPVTSSPVAATVSETDWLATAEQAYSNKDFAAALPLYEKGAEQGNARAQARLGLMYLDGKGVPKDLTKARMWIEKAAKQGDPVGENGLGKTYELGLGGPVVPEEAAAWYRRSAQKGYRSAQRNLGYCYQRGFGVARDYQEAMRWYRQAAEQDLPAIGCDIGLLYWEGLGVPKDAGKAVEWFEKAAAQGNREAYRNLGRIYETGDGVPKDEAKAAECYRKSAEGGHIGAQYYLGMMLLEGRGMKADAASGLEWLKKSADGGFAKAKQALAERQKQKTAGQPVEEPKKTEADQKKAPSAPAAGIPEMPE